MKINRTLLKWFAYSMAGFFCGTITLVLIAQVIFVGESLGWWK